MSNVMKNTATGQQSTLSSAKQALLAKWLREGPRAGENAPNDSIPRRTGFGPVPLSFGQQRLWFFHQLEGQSPLYTMPIGARLRGVLDLEALQQAFDAVVARHDTLRMRFVGEDPELVTDPPRSVPLTLIDLRNQQAKDREAEARRLLEAEDKRPFDLSKDLMMRAVLVRMDEE